MALGRLPCLRLFKYQITVLNTTKKEKRKINQELCRLRSEFHIMVLCTIFKGSQTVQKLLSTRFTTLNFSEELPEPVTSKPISLASWRRMKFCITVCCTAFLGKLCYPPVPVNKFFIFFSQECFQFQFPGRIPSTRLRSWKEEISYYGISYRVLDPMPSPVSCQLNFQIFSLSGRSTPGNGLSEPLAHAG